MASLTLALGISSWTGALVVSLMLVLGSSSWTWALVASLTLALGISSNKVVLMDRSEIRI